MGMALLENAYFFTREVLLNHCEETSFDSLYLISFYIITFQWQQGSF